VAEQLTEEHIYGAVAALSDNEVSPSIGGVAPLYRRTKGLIELSLAAALTILSTPLMAFIAVAIWLDSPGPILFRQQRIGLRGYPFTIYKFRTMSASAPEYSYKVSMSDARITKVGRWLRRSGLDELPQLFNVIRGEMSFIGPRPEQPFIVEQFQPWQRARHQIKPGITGWWQVHHRNDVPLHLNLDYDMYYLKHQSFTLDCQIVWRTVRIVILGAMAPSKVRVSQPDPIQVEEFQAVD
jgi:lipopolysaccharide/colanic/teichoic acid biosynthesis glycosyltransferase